MGADIVGSYTHAGFPCTAAPFLYCSSRGLERTQTGTRDGSVREYGSTGDGIASVPVVGTSYETFYVGICLNIFMHI